MLDLLISLKYFVFALAIILLMTFKVFKSKPVLIGIYILLVKFVLIFIYEFSTAYFSEIWPYFLVFAFILVTYTSYNLYLESLDFTYNSYFKMFIQYSFIALATFSFILDIFRSAITGYHGGNDTDTIQLEYPFEAKGSYFLIEGGNNSYINKNIDISARRYSLFISKGIERNISVISPCDGTIIDILETKNINLIKNSPGTSIILKCRLNRGEKLVFGNLDYNSLKVSVNDEVVYKQNLGRTGSSEYRQRYGLIIFAVNAATLDYDHLFNLGDGVRIKFDSKEYIKNDILKF